MLDSMSRRAMRLVVAYACVVLLALVSACGSDDGAGFAERIEDPFAGGYPIYRHEDSGLRVILGTPDIGVGEQRVSFSLFSPMNAGGEEGELLLITQPELTARIYHYPSGRGGDRVGPIDEQLVRFGELPPGGRGIYRGNFRFEDDGLYAFEVVIPTRAVGGGTLTVVIPLEVAAEPRAPDIGDDAPRSEHRTLADVGSIEEMTTSWAPDPALYQETIASALDSGRPLVVVFASPAFCTTALCGPQVELASELAAEYGDGAAFVHVDLYENPHEIQGDLDRARRSPVLDEWNIETDQWTFVVGADGRVTARFEGYVPRDELEAALLEVIEEP